MSRDVGLSVWGRFFWFCGFVSFVIEGSKESMLECERFFVRFG